ncbi:MAG: uncharacterized protein QOF84_7389 [Streptomyces sp.]|jgi:uncharacterized protein (DUF1684 family)|nr:uncharacterized protein [Streptomyces sp.]MDX6352599.1 uncharacterized protein [Streptomyces sp.]
MEGLNTMSSVSTDAQQEWKAWREQRAESVSAPYGPLSLTGTFWLVDAVDGRIEGVPGHWAEAPDGETVILTTDAGDRVTLDPDGEYRPADGDTKLVAIKREGLWAVRIWDPAAPTRRAFAGIEAFDYDKRWVLPAVFRPYGETRTIQVPNADGVQRGLGVGGELSFTVDDTEHTLTVAVEAGGGLWGVIADATSGKSTFRFRFVRTPAPAADDGSVVLDLNRAVLPPCSFSDGFICPFPPPGNTLPFAVEAGERQALTS